MKHLMVILLLCALVACVPVYTPAVPEPATPSIQAPVRNVSLEPKFDAAFANKTVTQTSDAGTTKYHLTKDDRLLKIEKIGAVWDYQYLNGTLLEITGPKDIQFFYENGKLSAIDVSPNRYTFKYDAKGRLVELDGGNEPLHFDYDNVLDQLRAVRRGVAGQTSIDYDKKGRIKYLTRGVITTDVYYDEDDHVNEFDSGDIKMILGYWRDGKVISFSGKTFGQGVAVSYGPNYSPTNASVIHSTDKSKFSSEYTDTLYTVVDQYLYCRYARTLKDVPFDGLAYGFFVSYFKGGPAEYLRMQYECLPYES